MLLTRVAVLQNGSINNVGVAGGTPNYMLVWKIGGAQIGSGNSLTNLGAGIYTLEVSDANGCMIDTSFTLVTGGSGGTATITAANSTFCPDSSTQICVSGTFASYLWNTGAATNCITVSQAGNYYVTVTDVGGCTAESNHLAISVYQAPPVSISVTGDTLSAYGAVAYQWYRNGSIINDATDSLYVITEGGVYTVVVTDGNGCKATSNGITISSLNERWDAEVKVRVFPNPVDDEVNMDVGGELVGSEFKVSDVAGKILIEQTVINPLFSFSTAKLTGGIYFVRIGNITLKLFKK